MKWLHCLKNVLKKGDHMCKLSMKDEYFSIPLNPCPISLVRQAKWIPLPLFRSWTKFKNFYQVKEHAVAVLHRINTLVIFYLVIDWLNITRSSTGQRHCSLPSLIAGFYFQSKSISLNSHTENLVPRGASRFSFEVFTKRETVESSRTTSIGYSENPSINVRVEETNRFFVFHNSYSIVSPNKFLISATTANRSIEDTQVMQQKVTLTKVSRLEFRWCRGNVKASHCRCLIHHQGQVMIHTDELNQAWGVSVKKQLSGDNDPKRKNKFT